MSSKVLLMLSEVSLLSIGVCVRLFLAQNEPTHVSHRWCGDIFVGCVFLCVQLVFLMGVCFVCVCREIFVLSVVFLCVR